MTRRILISILFVLGALSVRAQLYQSAVHIGWNTIVPLSDKEFTSRTSSAGMRFGFSKFVNDRFGFGLEGSYNTIDDYVPLREYEYQGGTISTDVYNYLYYFTVLANAQYYFKQGNKFIPYASLGMGMAFSEYRIFYNVYEDTDNQNGFVIRPEIGTFFRTKEYSSWGLKSSLSYEYAANKSDYFQIDNFSGVSFQIGLVLFVD